jgi:hypothetical protein
MYSPTLNVALQDRWWIPRPIWATFCDDDNGVTAGDYADRGAVDLHQLAADGNTRYLLAIARTVWQRDPTNAIEEVIWDLGDGDIRRPVVAAAKTLYAHLIDIGIDFAANTNNIDLHVMETLPLSQWLTHTLTSGTNPHIRHADITYLLNDIAAANPTGDTTAVTTDAQLSFIEHLLNSDAALWAYCALTRRARELHGVAAELTASGAAPGDIVGVLTVLQPAGATT